MLRRIAMLYQRRFCHDVYGYAERHCQPCYAELQQLHVVEYFVFVGIYWTRCRVFLLAVHDVLFRNWLRIVVLF